MDFFIHCKGLQISRETRARVASRLESGLNRFAEEVSRVHTTLENVNGPRGGRDKRCVVTVTLSHSGEPIVSSARHKEIEGAVGLAARRATRSLAARVEKRTQRQHVPPPEVALTSSHS